MFPQNKILPAGGTQRTFMEVLKFYDKIYGEIIMIAGSDRINEFQKLADKYNGKDYNYKSVKVVSSGDRDPDAEGVAGMSASKMREMAKNNDYKTFKTGLTRNLSDRDAKQLFDAVKKGMGLNERYESFTDFLNNDIREEYHQEKIFNVGDMIEHVNGSTGTIVRRGTNYVSYENDGLVKKAWLYDIQELEEKTLQNEPSVLETLEIEMDSADEYFELNQVGVKTVESYEIGTDKYRKHTQMMTPGQPILSFKLANKVIERTDIELFANEDKIIDKYKKRYGDRWEDELDKAVTRMKKEL
jgi:hypothetical protein